MRYYFVLLEIKKSKPKPVLLLSTESHAANSLVTTRSGKVVNKPLVVKKYNVGMGGVDLSDKKLYHVAADRPTRRYWKKIFQNLLDISVLNAYIIYCNNTDRNNLLQRRDFIIEIIETLCQQFQTSEPSPQRVPLKKDEESHEYTKLPLRKERYCAVCSERGLKKRSRHWCPACQVGVHEDCWKHLQHYHRKLGRKRKLIDMGSADNDN